MSLFQIDQLIRKTEYDEALKQLNIYIKNNPENFDNAQQRISKIMNARIKYSQLAEKLIKIIETDPNNNKEIYEITAQLEKFERNPSDENLKFIADVKKSAEFNYFRSLFLEIQRESAALSESENYIGAIKKVSEGYWLYKDNFYTQWEDNQEIIDQVNIVIADIETETALFETKEYTTVLQNSINDFIQNVNNDNYNGAVAKLGVVQKNLRAYCDLRLKFYKNAADLQSLFEKVQKLDNDTTDASFLPFMYRFILGIDAVEHSGICGAINLQFENLAGKMNQACFNKILLNYNEMVKTLAVENLADSNYRLSENYYKNISNYASLEKSVLNLFDISKSEKFLSIKNPYEIYSENCDYLVSLGKNTLVLEKNYIDLSEKSGNLVNQFENNKSEYFKNIFASLSDLKKTAGNKENQQLENAEWAKAYFNKNDQWKNLEVSYSQILEKLFYNLEENEKKNWKNVFAYYTNLAASSQKEITEEREAASKYKAGFYTKIDDSKLQDINKDVKKSFVYVNQIETDESLNFGINYSYPDISLSIGKYEKSKIETEISRIQSYEKILKDNFALQNLKDEQINSDFEKTLVYLEEEIAKYREMLSENNSFIKLCESQIMNSTLAKNEAQIRFSEAEAALKKNDFDLARKKLQESLSKYDESLSLKNDEALREKCDSDLQALGEKITKNENELVVKQVRDLKNQAKDAYFNGRFSDAEKLLNEAKTRWAVTNVNEDSEISNLLSFVTTALSLNTGREISPSAPQYPEMSQLINIAYQYYDEAVDLLNKGETEEGNKKLDLASENIQKLQFVYPLNQEASILNLKISKIKNPEKFEEEFSFKIETARMMCKNKATQNEGYANLLDYYKLEPDYKGLKDLIYQVEIDLGIRQKPVDNSLTVKAKKLLNDAKSLYNKAGSDTEKLNQALAKVDECLAINSNDKDAQALKDEIITKIGGTTSTVLSTEDERLYQLAIQRLQNNNVAGASAIVNQLLKKKQNANSQKIKDLKVKVDARI